LAPSVTEILYELGAQDEIVCSTVFCDYPDSARKLPKVGSWTHINFEKLKGLTPEIVFTSSAVQGKLTGELRDQGFKVVNINPLRLNDVVESYNQIGVLVGKREAAERLSSSLYQKIMGFHLHAANKEPVRVYCEEWSNPPMVAGNWVPDLVELAGGRAMAEAGKLSREFDFLEIKEFNPKLIVLHICGMGTRVDPLSVARRDGWEELEAVKSGRIQVIDDSHLNRPTSRLFEGLYKLKKIINENQSQV